MFFLIMIMVLIALFQVPALVRHGYWGELAAFSLLWIISGAYATLVVLNVPLIAPTDLLIEYLPRLLPLPPILTPP